MLALYEECGCLVVLALYEYLCAENACPVQLCWPCCILFVCLTILGYEPNTIPITSIALIGKQFTNMNLNLSSSVERLLFVCLTIIGYEYSPTQSYITIENATL